MLRICRSAEPFGVKWYEKVEKQINTWGKCAVYFCVKYFGVSGQTYPATEVVAREEP